MSWIDEKGPIKDVVLSSRIRLARNIANIPFPTHLQQQNALQVIEQVKSSICDGNSVLGKDFVFLTMGETPAVERQILVEKHLASQDLMQKPEIAALLYDKKERVSIMVNEEDHIRMQCILPGLQLDQAWEYLNKIDDVLEENIAYSFDEQLGYLTSCPTNVGTGLRASIMVHLPALTMTKHIGVILQTLPKIGLTARGLYGEGSEALGNIYQISNQITLGPSEEEIIHNLAVASQQIIEKERMARKALVKVNGLEFEDSIWRAFGLLLYARKLELKEYMSLISQVRLGVNLGFIKTIAMEELDELVILGQSGGLQKNAGYGLSEEEQDIRRAAFVRHRLEEGCIRYKETMQE